MKRPRLDGDEQDAFSRRGKQRFAGVRKVIKRQVNKRERREVPELSFGDLLEDPDIQEMLAKRRRREG